MNVSIFAASSSGIGAGMLIIWLVVVVLAVAGMWATFQKAGKPGWAAIIPIYNVYVLLQVAGRPGWWLILFLVPFVNLIISLVVSIDVAKAFGKDAVFGVIGLWLFSIIGYLMLGFGSAKYQGQSQPQGGQGGATPPPAAPGAPSGPSAPTAPTPPAPPQAPAA